MTKEILSYYGLEGLPFSKEIKTKDLLNLPSFDKAMDKIRLLIEMKGIGILIGKSGTGKSCLIRKLMKDLNPGLYKPLYICHSSVTLFEFYTHLANALGLEPKQRRAAMYRDIKDRILSLNRNDRVHPVLFIDEAHLLRNEILKEIRLLTNFEVDSFNGITIVLCGQEYLAMRFGLSILESLANSISISVKLSGLSKDETFAYIEKRLSVMGLKSPLFTKNAMALIHQASGGSLRSINLIAGSTMMKAYLTKASQIETEHVAAIIEGGNNAR